jgi:hypothetical protein
MVYQSSKKLLYFLLLFCATISVFAQDLDEAASIKVQTSDAIVAIDLFSKNGEFLTRSTGFFINSDGWFVTSSLAVTDPMTDRAGILIVTTSDKTQYTVNTIYFLSNYYPHLAATNVAIGKIQVAGNAFLPLAKFEEEVPPSILRVIGFHTNDRTPDVYIENVSSKKILTQFESIYQFTKKAPLFSLGAPILTRNGEVVEFLTETDITKRIFAASEYVTATKIYAINSLIKDLKLNITIPESWDKIPERLSVDKSIVSIVPDLNKIDSVVGVQTELYPAPVLSNRTSIEISATPQYAFSRALNLSYLIGQASAALFYRWGVDPYSQTIDTDRKHRIGIEYSIRKLWDVQPPVGVNSRRVAPVAGFTHDFSVVAEFLEFFRLGGGFGVNTTPTLFTQSYYYSAQGSFQFTRYPFPIALKGGYMTNDVLDTHWFTAGISIGLGLNFLQF